MATDKTGYVSVGARIEDKIMPDRVIFSIGFGGRFDTKEACLDDYNADRAKVAAALAPFGLDDELTCRRYTCYAQTTHKRAIIVGYDYYAYGTVAAPVDSVDCAAVWAALNTCGSHADMNIRFELADERAAEDVLIARAVERARGNAQALAAAAGTKLGGIKHISYNSRPGDYGTVYCAAKASRWGIRRPWGNGAGSGTHRGRVFRGRGVVAGIVDEPGERRDFMTEKPFVEPGARG